jgi:aspartate carbamoyltransferase catalytic subunit
LAQDVDHSRAVVNTAMTLRLSQNAVNFLTSPTTIKLSGWTVLGEVRGVVYPKTLHGTLYSSLNQYDALHSRAVHSNLYITAELNSVTLVLYNTVQYMR